MWEILKGRNNKLKWLLILAIAIAATLFLTSNASAADPQRILYWGSRGDDVAQLQDMLTRAGYNLGSIDGVFGYQTSSAVSKFQKDHGLDADGVAGPQTIAALNKATANEPTVDRNLSWGDTGDDVLAVQKALNWGGYSAGEEDGVFGDKTNDAVVKLQLDYELEADGIVGPQTWRLINMLTGHAALEDIPSYANVIPMVATAYDDSYESNNQWTGYPSYIGLPLKPGIVAVDPVVIALGSKLYVEGYGLAIAADIGGAIKGNRIDLFYPTHQSALDYGIQNISAYILQ
ncbi:MAG: peptidoglycan-binding protein [Acidobacteriota bacterium]